MKRSLIIVLLLLAGCATTPVQKVDKTKMAEGYYLKGMSHFQEQNYELASVEFNRSLQTDEDLQDSRIICSALSAITGASWMIR